MRIGMAKLVAIFLLALVVLWFIFVAAHTGFVLQQISVRPVETDGLAIEEATSTSSSLTLPEMPVRRRDLVTGLIVGIRGSDDPNGGLLADMIMVVAYDRKTARGLFISIPRDLVVPTIKINEVFAHSVAKGGYARGMADLRTIVSRITGLYIEHIVVVNFRAFESVIDLVGGVPILRETEFREDKQWGCDTKGQKCSVFIVPKGETVLKGSDALYYVRSRYSSSDFDRALRQYEVIRALGEKLLKAGFIANPINIFQMIEIVGANVLTDMSPAEIRQLVTFAFGEKDKAVSSATFVYNSGPGGFLYETSENGSYVLKPTEDDFRNLAKPVKALLNK